MGHIGRDQFYVPDVKGQFWQKKWRNGGSLVARDCAYHTTYLQVVQELPARFVCRIEAILVIAVVIVANKYVKFAESIAEAPVILVVVLVRIDVVRKESTQNGWLQVHAVEKVCVGGRTPQQHRQDQQSGDAHDAIPQVR
jgi:hypothetical protein